METKGGGNEFGCLSATLYELDKLFKCVFFMVKTISDAAGVCIEGGK